LQPLSNVNQAASQLLPLLPFGPGGFSVLSQCEITADKMIYSFFALNVE